MAIESTQGSASGGRATLLICRSGHVSLCCVDTGTESGRSLERMDGYGAIPARHGRPGGEGRPGEVSRNRSFLRGEVLNGVYGGPGDRTRGQRRVPVRAV